MVTDGLSQTILLSERIVGDFDSSVFTPSRDTYYYDGPPNPPFLETPTDYAEACATRFTNPLRGEMSFGGATWLLAGKAYTIYNHVLGPNSVTPDCTAAGPWMYDSATTARSWHRGGVNVAFADGSTRFIAESIDVYLWRALGTRNGREVVDE